MVADLTFQDAWFRRGDSARLIVAAELPPIRTAEGLRPVSTNMNGVLWLQSDYNKPYLHASASGASQVLFDLMAEPKRILASIESKHAAGPLGRVRFGSGPQEMPEQRVTLSDVLLFESGAALPSSLEEGATRARSNTTLQAGAATGLFWEIYGLRANENLHMSILVVPQRGREPVRLGGAARQTATDVVVISWDESGAVGAPIEVRAVNLNLGALRRGTYTISVSVSVPGQDVVESVRTIEIVR